MSNEDKKKYRLEVLYRAANRLQDSGHVLWHLWLAYADDRADILALDDSVFTEIARVSLEAATVTDKLKKA